METTDIVIHKGEKEDRYQLYVEDYVMSYLKKYKNADSKKIFFYGTREQKDKKYYIYGAGMQKNISYFVRYELLEEIVCRCDMDMPVFYIKEEAGRYELAGYYIFYHTNEAMQSYMIEQKKEGEFGEKEKNKIGVQSNSAVQSKIAGASKAVAQSKSRPQDFSDIRTRSSMRTSAETQKERSFKNTAEPQTNIRKSKKKAESFNGGIMAIQLFAIFLVLSAIIINSTNSYTKLQDLGQSAVEVFFTMENQKAQGENVKQSVESEKQLGEDGKQTGESAKQPEGTTLRLEDLDVEFEKENQTAKQEKAEGEKAEGEKAEGEKAEGEKAESESGESENASETENEKTDGVSEEKQEDENVSEVENEEVEAFARNTAEYYQIEKGDTLCNISIKVYGDASRVKEICEINKIENPDNIKYGQKIILP